MYMMVELDSMDSWRQVELSKKLGVQIEVSFYACALVWRQLYRRANEGRGMVMSEAEIDGSGRIPGMACAMVASDLAERVDGGFRIKGDERVRKMLDAKERQSKKAKDRWKSKGDDKSHAAAEPRQSRGNAEVMPSISISSSLSLFSSPEPEKTTQRPEGSSPRAKGAHQEFVAFWDQAYTRATSAKYGWEDKRQFTLVKSLLATYGLEQCKARAEVLLGSQCPDWLSRGGRDLATLKQHWNKLAPVPPGQRAWKPEELAAWAEAQMALERAEEQGGS